MMCVCRILIKITYLLTYLFTYLLDLQFTVDTTSSTWPEYVLSCSA